MDEQEISHSQIYLSGGEEFGCLDFSNNRNRKFWKYIMPESKNKQTKNVDAATPPHPGKVLQKAIEEESLEWNAYWFALSEAELVLLFAGDIALSADLAVRLGHLSFAGRSAKEWMKLQADYDLYLAEERLRFF